MPITIFQALVYGIVQGGDGDPWLSLGVLGPIAGGLAILAAGDRLGGRGSETAVAGSGA